MEEELIWLNSNQYRLSAILNYTGSPNTPIVVMCHGWSRDKNGSKYRLMQEGLESSDIASLRFDFRGHGESEGPKQESSEYALLRDLTSATDYLMGLGYSPNVIGLFGSSTGARI